MRSKRSAIRTLHRSEQRGAVLMIMLAIVVAGASWALVSRLHQPSEQRVANRMHNAKVLMQAKQALIGYVAQRAAITGEDSPGRLPCPEAPGNFANADNQGEAGGNCTLPAVGRLPWKTLGLEKLVDASGEPLWYVVSEGWALKTGFPPEKPVINSDSVGQLNVDGNPNFAVALIIAPGPAFVVPAAAGCSARSQTRPTSGPPNVADYLECENATSPADASFVTSGPDAAFNDQVVRVAANEVLPLIESAVASRFVREFGPSMRYCGSPWPDCSSSVVFPFAAPMADPTTSNFQGASGTTQGLLPLTYGTSGACTPAPCNPASCDPLTDERCDPTFVSWIGSPTIVRTSGATLYAYACSIAGTPTAFTCTLLTVSSVFSPNGSLDFQFSATASNVGMSLRQVNTSALVDGIDTDFASPTGYTVTGAALAADGAATIAIASRLPTGGGVQVADADCGLGGFGGIFNNCFQHTIAVPLLFTDALVLDVANADTAWFYRNSWHQHMYYAVSTRNVSSGSGSCVTDTDCVSVLGFNPSGSHRALVVAPGAALSGQPRPPVGVADWLEGTNASGDLIFGARDATLLVGRTFNDRIVVIDSNP